MIELSEQHFVPLPSQSSIYGLTVLGGSKTALVASLRQRPSTYLVSVEYVEDTAVSKKVNPVSKEVHFTYIPGGAEIISIDNFNKSTSGKNFVVGITFSKPGDSASMQYFNVYTDWEETKTLSLELIAQSCISLKLNFVPYHLYHTEIWKPPEDTAEIAWLLSGSDGEIHLYREDTNQHTYCDHDVKEYFPEFVQLKRIVLWMDIMYYEKNTRRLAVVGCEDGYVRATATRITNSGTEILFAWDIKHDSPIARVNIFQLNAFKMKRPAFLGINNTDTQADDVGHSKVTPDLHLLVTSSLETTVIYWNVLTSEGLVDQRQLPSSDNFDCVSCACVADIDMDGQNEIILGTYGQEMLLYKWSTEVEEFELIKQRSFAYPLLSIDYVDMTGDGLNELIVLSTKGLHILQHDLNAVADRVIERLEELTRSLNIDDDIDRETLAGLKSEVLEPRTTEPDDSGGDGDNDESNEGDQ